MFSTISFVLGLVLGLFFTDLSRRVRVFIKNHNDEEILYTYKKLRDTMGGKIDD